MLSCGQTTPPKTHNGKKSIGHVSVKMPVNIVQNVQCASYIYCIAEPFTVVPSRIVATGFSFLMLYSVDKQVVISLYLTNFSVPIHRQ